MNRCKTCRFWEGPLKYQSHKKCTNTDKKLITAINMDQYGISNEYSADYLYTQIHFGCTEYEESL